MDKEYEVMSTASLMQSEGVDERTFRLAKEMYEDAHGNKAAGGWSSTGIMERKGWYAKARAELRLRAVERTIEDARDRMDTHWAHIANHRHMIDAAVERARSTDDEVNAHSAWLQSLNGAVSSLREAVFEDVKRPGPVRNISLDEAWQIFPDNYYGQSEHGEKATVDPLPDPILGRFDVIEKLLYSVLDALKAKNRTKA